MILGWQKLEAEELASAWEALEAWVWWLRSTYPAAREAVVDCWPRHPDLLNELTALCVWWEEIYEPLDGAEPAPDKPTPGGADECSGRSAVSWHEALNHAVQRWRSTTKCSRSECELDKQYDDLDADWRKRHSRTLSAIEEVRQSKVPLLGAGAPPPDKEG